jgi:hypothetical protein
MTTNTGLDLQHRRGRGRSTALAPATPLVHSFATRCSHHASPGISCGFLGVGVPCHCPWRAALYCRLASCTRLERAKPKQRTACVTFLSAMSQPYPSHRLHFFPAPRVFPRAHYMLVQLPNASTVHAKGRVDTGNSFHFWSTLHELLAMDPS